jgi:ParB family chromosome partitioning protein
MTSKSPSVASWPTLSLKPNPLNPRGDVDASGLDDLAASIHAQGVLQPLLITPDGVVVAGHRRLAGARMAGLEQVPVVVRDLDPVQQQEIMLVENLQRQDLSPVRRPAPTADCWTPGTRQRNSHDRLARRRLVLMRGLYCSSWTSRSSGCFTAAISR